jgi:Uma2 family endonuclease
MYATIPKPMSFDEFLEWHPEDGRIFELYEGVPTELNPTGTHEAIAGFLSLKLGIELDRASLPYFIPKTATVKPYRERQGYKPDVVLLDRAAIAHEPDWAKKATIHDGATVKLAIEVASTNWRDDYGVKLTDYEEMGIPEYWIVDYIPLGAARYIGSPKRPTITVYQWVDGEYFFQQFRADEQVISAALPGLQLTADQIFNSAEV